MAIRYKGGAQYMTDHSSDRIMPIKTRLGAPTQAGLHRSRHHVLHDALCNIVCREREREREVEVDIELSNTSCKSLLRVACWHGRRHRSERRASLSQGSACPNPRA